MCGIVGYIGDKAAVPVLINGLKKLEYRGYDSAGVAVIDAAADADITNGMSGGGGNGMLKVVNGNGMLKVVKCKGRLSVLEQKLADEYPDGSLGSHIGIGHTRWATHGEPNDINSHPHSSHSGKIAVVHNGIIENYMKIKEFLISKGYCFVSETDTEVVAHLVEYHYQGDLAKAVTSAVQELEGSYALGVICSDCTDRFVAVRKDSPLIIGIGKGEMFIASDIPALLEHTRDIYILEDNEIAVIDRHGARIFDTFGMEVKKDVFHVDWDVTAAEKSGYEHFMMKEMCEEPKALRNTVNPRLLDGSIVLDGVNITKEELCAIEKIYIVACGTAYHAGMVGKYVIEKFARIPVETDVASEFRYRDPLVSEKNLVIIISQSGETIDTLFALREARKKGAKTLSIVNTVGSSIARESDNVLYTWAGPEIAVASTKAYNTQVAALYLIALDFALKRGTMDEATFSRMADSMRQMPSVIEKILNDKEKLQKFASQHFNAKSIFFIGRGLDYALSMEGSLKLKEISYIHSEAYTAGELKHGTIALIEQGTLVICSMTQDRLFEKMVSNIKEVKARGATVMVITQERNKNVESVADMVITIPDIDSDIAPIAAVTPMQLFAYYMAVLKDCDVDKPRNLAKSVTVE